MSEPIGSSCLRLSEIMPDISHDSVNRFLSRERYTGQDLFNENKSELNLHPDNTSHKTINVK